MKAFQTRSLVAAALAPLLLAPSAYAQSFDGSSSAQAKRAIVNVSCGAPVGNLVRTDNAALTFSNTGFITLTGSGVSVTVPAGQSRCVKVIFTAEAAATNFCYVQAVDNGVPLKPDGGGFQALVSRDSSSNAHALQWAARIGAGTHTIAIQRRVDTGSCNIDDWAVDVEVRQ